MGLDNGVVVKNKDNTNVRAPWYIKPCFEEDVSNELIVCYWRKWWWLRDEILGGVKDIRNLTKNDLKYIRKLVLSYTFSPKKLRYYCGGYWDYNIWYGYGMRNGIQYMFNLTWAILNYKKYNFYFYDSF